MNSRPFQVELSGIIKILSDHLYTHKEVFIRELIQNARDAITARKKIEAFDPQVLIEYFENAEGSGFIIRDNGIGLTEDQITEFLARIGSSSKSLDQYDELRSDFIGQFGIGILSCFMVSDEIVLLTRSVTGDKSFRWTGYINGTYQVEELEENLDPGTKVILKLRKEVKIKAESILTSIKTFAEYIDLPISLEVNAAAPTSINQAFPWEITSQYDASLNLGREIFEQPFSNYFLLNPTDECSVKGIVYLLPFTDHLTQQTDGRIYVKRMFVTKKCEDILPDWAVFVKVMLNSNDLDLNASRENIHSNEKSEELKNHIAFSIKQYLLSLAKNAPKTLTSIIAAHSASLKRIALSDPDFLGFIYKWFTFPTTHGALSLEEIKQRSSAIYFVPNVDEFRQIAPIAAGNNRLVINTGYIHDASIIRQISKIDNATSYIEVDAAYFGNFLGEVDINEYDGYRDRIKSLQQHLDKFNCKIEMKQFSPENIPAIYHATQDTQLSRDIEDISANSSSDWALISEGVFGDVKSNASRIYLNFNNRIVKTLIKQSSKYDQPVIETLLTNAMLMGHYPLNFLELESMNHNLNQMATFALSQQ